MGYFVGLTPAGKLSISTWEVLRYKVIGDKGDT